MPRPPSGHNRQNPCTQIDDTKPLPTSSRLLLPRTRIGRRIWQTPLDPYQSTSFGDSINEKDPSSFRLFFQNVKGLTYSTGMEDYTYYIQCMMSLHVDVFGLTETNTSWQQYHLQAEFRKQVKKYHKQSKVVFGYPSTAIDKCHEGTTYQPGGNLTMVQGSLTASAYGSEDDDQTGLGRWSSITFRGKEGFKLTTISAYRTCGGNIRTASLGSTYSREYNYFRDLGHATPNPRRLFLQHIEKQIKTLQSKGHAIVFMLDANSDLTDTHFSAMVSSCDLVDLHQYNSPPSTYIGSPTRRIDYMFGCHITKAALKRSGTLSYTEGPQSDHRGLFVDLHIPELQSFRIPTPMASAQHRYLHTGNPELVESYLANVRTYFETHKMVSRIEALTADQETRTPEELQTLLNGWDADLGRAMQLAEKNLRIPKKKYAWSPTLRNAAITRRYWKLRLREVTTNANYTQTFTRWQAKVQLVDPDFHLPYLEVNLPIELIRQYLNAATKLLRCIQRNATDIRQRTYEQLLLDYTNDTEYNNTPDLQRKAKIVQRTIDSEMCRSMFRNIRDVIKPTTHSSLGSIEIPKSKGQETIHDADNFHEVFTNYRDDEIQWETIVDKHQVEQQLLRYNREAFRAAAKSPCGHGIIYNAITFTSLSDEAKHVLEGMVPASWHGDDNILKEFLASFTIPPSVKKAGLIDTRIEEKDVREGFAKWTESTTTSPSGRHLGHYKAIVQDPTLLRCLTSFLNVALQSGLTLPRWSAAVNVMIEKDPGSPKIHRLRIIHLFEADFNFLLKLTWGKRLVKRAVELDLLHDGQHGSIPGRTTMDPIMLTLLTTDIARVNKTNIIRFDNDASACYDRIIVALGMMAARRCGMPDHAIRTHAKALEWMKYKVKTIYGISEENYSGTEFEPLFGTGQGSGASPAVWLTLVVILLHTLDRLIPERMSFSSPDGCIHHSRLTDAYVDDTSLGFTDNQETCYIYEELIRRLQQVAQTWSHLLELSGGTLNFKKCSWYVMFWEWKNGRPTLRKHQPDDPDIALKSILLPDMPPTKIARKELSDGQRMLGVYITPNGDFAAQLQQYRRKTTQFATRLHSPRIKASDIRVFHRSVYTPTMRYGLAATVVRSPKDLQTIQGPVIATMLQKLGVSSKIPTAIRHGPLALGGLDLYDLRTEIGIEQLKFLRDALYSNSAAGKMIMISLHSLQQEAGVSYPLLAEPEHPILYLTDTWLTSVRAFLADHNIKINISDQPVLLPRSTTDTFIMQEDHLQRYTRAQQRDINMVRIYLQVTTLADITDTNRLEAVSLNALDGVRHQDHEYNTTWPRQETPSKQQRRLWKRYIQSSFLRYIPMWKKPPLTISDLQTFNSQPQVPHPIKSAHITPTSYPTLQAYIRKLPRTQQRLLDGASQTATDLQIWRALRSKERLLIASDGGLDGQHGTFGWVLASKKQVLYECGGPVDGPFDTNSSTRCEICGFASALLLATVIQRHWGLKHRCVFQWVTDSRAALARVIRMTKSSVPRRLPPDSDLLSLIRSLLWELRRSVTMQWVKGHQDKLRSYDKLSREAKMNMSADFLATRYRERGKLKPMRTIDHPFHQRISILLNGTRLTSQYDECLRYHINGYHLRQYIQGKRKWSDRTWDSIDFDLYGKHFRSLGHSSQIFQMKVSHDQLPIGKMRLLRSQVPDPTLAICPCCTRKNEDTTHLFQCQHNASIAKGQQELLKDHKNPEPHPIRRIIVEGIQHWASHSSECYTPAIMEYPNDIQESITRAVTSQNIIGWESAIKGYLCKQWTDLASRSLNKSGDFDLSTGHKRMRRLISDLHSYAKTIWKTRNATLHDGEVELGKLTRTAEEAEIRHIFENPLSLHFDERYLCDRSLDTLLNSSTSNQRRWLRRARISQKQQHNDGNRQTKLTRYFRTSTGP